MIDKNKSQIELSKSKELRILKIQTVVFKAFTNTDNNVTIDEVNTITDDLHNHFNKTKTENIIQGIENGCFGKYGIPFKLTPIVFGNWINKHLEQKEIERKRY